jgi:hypothetical protein
MATVTSGSALQEKEETPGSRKRTKARNGAPREASTRSGNNYEEEEEKPVTAASNVSSKSRRAG